ncbi:MAG: GMC family oxidoreductase [Solirubrobacteraceae bacterium]
MIYDHVIVGAGTTGCALAARLTEEPARQVLLLEAGPDYARPAALPEALADSYGMPREPWDWGLQATIADRPAPLPSGRVVGGTSQIGGAGAWRPPAADFAAWGARGLPEWSWAGVVDAFCRVETDRDHGDAPWHGDRGPVPVTRWREDELTGPMRGFLEAALAAGLPYCEDMNAVDALGVGPNPMARDGRRRVSAAAAYLDPARSRPGLHVRSGATVERIALAGDRVRGVVVDGEVVEGREVVVCAGVPLSPALLLRSGIGPAAGLTAAGVPCAVDLPGVGGGVMDQPAATILAVPRENGDGEVPFLQLAARGPGFAGCTPDGAAYFCLFAHMPVEPALEPLLRAPRVHWLIVADLAPAGRGRVTLRSGDPHVPPVCDLGLYAADGDLARMRAGMRAAWELAQHPAFTAQVERFALVGERTIGNDPRLDDLLRKRTMSRQPWGGCPMGGAGDPDAVVDARCRVRGVDGLRVADASIVPVPLRAGGVLTCLMIGERLAELMAGDGG